MMCLHRFLFFKHFHFSKKSFNVTELLNLIHIPYDVEILEIVSEVLRHHHFHYKIVAKFLGPIGFNSTSKVLRGPNKTITVLITS